MAHGLRCRSAGRHGAPSGWDDLAGWTGSVVCGDDGIWRALSAAGHGILDQRIGIIESEDLYVWWKPTERRKQTYGRFSTWSVTRDSIMGPWHIARARPSIHEPRYSPRRSFSSAMASGH